MTLWVMVHLKGYPASGAELTDWQIGLIYEIAMHFSEEGLRRNYWEQKKSIVNVDDSEMLNLGYTREEIARIKGQKK